MSLPHNQHKQRTFDPATNLLPQIGVRLKRPFRGRYRAEAEWLQLDGSKADIQVFTLHWNVIDKLDHRP